jgi:excisionase family DNA binding protein
MSDPPRDRRIPDLVSLTEAAEMLAVSRTALHKMAVKGQLRGARVGTTWVFRRAAVEQHKQTKGQS